MYCLAMEDWKNVFLRIVSKYLNNPDPSTESVFITGAIDLSKCYPPIIEFMNWWVSCVDQQLAYLSQGEADYFYLLSLRGFTWEEYALVFDNHITEEHFPVIRIFEYLEIYNNADRLLFQASYALSEEAYLDFLVSHLPMISELINETVYVYKPISKLRHGLISGQSGSGKSELLKMLFYSLVLRCIENTPSPEGICLIDPHAEIAQTCARFRCIPEDRLVYIDVTLGTNAGSAVTINPFRFPDPSPEFIDKASEEFCQTFGEIIKLDSKLSLPMESLLVPAIHTLIAKGDAGLSDLVTFFDDNRNHDLVELGKQSINPQIREFFAYHFMDKSYASTKIALIKRISWLLQTDVIRSFMNGDSTLDFTNALNTGKIIICNLSSEVSEKIAAILGKYLVALVKLATFGRAKLAKRDRPVTYLLIDELPVFFSNSESSKTILDQGRKYGIHLFGFLQHVSQLEGSLKESILNNSNLKIIGASAYKSIKELSLDINIPLSYMQAMEDYNFTVQLNNYPAAIIKPPAVLIKVENNHQYYWNHEVMYEILVRQLLLYYRSWTYGQLDEPDELQSSDDQKDHDSFMQNDKNEKVDRTESSKSETDKSTPAKPKYL